MKKTIMTCLVALLLSGPAYAGKEEKIQELLSLFNLDALYNSMDKQITDPIECGFVLSETDKEKIRKQIKDIFNVSERATRAGRNFYDKYFTEAEIDDVLAFYKTPTGKKTIELLPKMGQYISEEMMPYMQTVAPKMEEFFQGLSKKYKQRPEYEIRACLSRKAGQ